MSDIRLKKLFYRSLIMKLTNLSGKRKSLLDAIRELLERRTDYQIENVITKEELNFISEVFTPAQTDLSSLMLDKQWKSLIHQQIEILREIDIDEMDEEKKRKIINTILREELTKLLKDVAVVDYD